MWRVEIEKEKIRIWGTKPHEDQIGYSRPTVEKIFETMYLESRKERLAPSVFQCADVESILYDADNEIQRHIY